MVLKARLELARPYGHQILSLGCLPIPSFEHISDSRLPAAYLFLIFILLFRAFARLVASFDIKD